MPTSNDKVNAILKNKSRSNAYKCWHSQHNTTSKAQPLKSNSHIAPKSTLQILFYKQHTICSAQPTPSQAHSFSYANNQQTPKKKLPLIPFKKLAAIKKIILSHLPHQLHLRHNRATTQHLIYHPHHIANIGANSTLVLLVKCNIATHRFPVAIKSQTY
jgi:hypothetical protein